MAVSTANVKTGYRRSPGKVSIKDLKKRSETLLVKIGILTGTGVHPSSAFSSIDEQADAFFAGGQAQEATFAQIMFWLEFGTKRFKGWHPMKINFTKNKSKYASLIKRLSRGVLLGNVKMSTAEALLGFTAQSDLQSHMEKTMSPANKEATQAIKGEKKAPGMKINNPMVDTGLTINRITWAPAIKR